MSVVDDPRDLQVEIPDGDLKCPICHDYFHEPICTSCGHHFCRSCLLEWLSTQRNVSTCPECRHIFPFGFDKNYLRLTKADVFLSSVLRQTIYVDCPRSCGALVHPSRMMSHDEDCRQFPLACDNRVFGCTAVVTRNNMRDHMNVCRSHTCSARIVGCNFTATLNEIAAHEKECVLHLLKTYIDRCQRQDTSVVNNNPRPPSNTAGNVLEGLMTATLMGQDLRPHNQPPTRQAMQDIPAGAVTRNVGDHSIINVSFRDLETLASTFGQIGQPPT